jgi:hypothetical protein
LNLPFPAAAGRGRGKDRLLKDLPRISEPEEVDDGLRLSDWDSASFTKAFPSNLAEPQAI